MDILTALRVYKDLADWYERQRQAAMRDRFLILAAEAAFSSGNPDEAERLRQRLLQGSPHHMLKPFTSFAQALQSTNIQIYIHDLQVNYPPEAAEELLQNLRSGASPAPPAAEERENTLEAGPQISPVIEIRDEPPQPLSPAVEPLKVYPLRDEPPAKPPQPNRPAARPPLSPSDRGERKGPPRPRSQPILPRPAAPASAPPPPPPEAAVPSGAWLTLILFGMIVTAGIVLAFYTLARPFLPLP